MAHRRAAANSILTPSLSLFEGERVAAVQVPGPIGGCTLIEPPVVTAIIVQPKLRQGALTR